MTESAEKVAQDLSEDFIKILTEIQQRKETRRKQLDALEKACRSSPVLEEMRGLLAKEREEKQSSFKRLTQMQDDVWTELQAKMEVYRREKYGNIIKYIFIYLYLYLYINRIGNI